MVNNEGGGAAYLGVLGRAMTSALGRCPFSAECERALQDLQLTLAPAPAELGDLMAVVSCATRPNARLERSAPGRAARCGTASVRSSTVTGARYSKGGCAKPGNPRSGRVGSFLPPVCSAVRAMAIRGGESDRQAAGVGSVAAEADRGGRGSQPSGLASRLVQLHGGHHTATIFRTRRSPADARAARVPLEPPAARSQLPTVHTSTRCWGEPPT
jgi:hypothetical protein